MKKLMITVAAMAALGAAVPASAQFGGPNYGGPNRGWDQNARGPNFDNRIDQLESMIQRGVQRGSLTQNEARKLRDDVRSLHQLDRQYRRAGYSWSERDRMDRRIDNLRDKIERNMRDGERRYGRDRDGWRDGRRL